MSKKKQIWDYLKKHRSITALEAWDLCHYGRLAGYICIWKENGIDIRKKTERNDKGEHWARYYITQKEAKRAEKEGLVFGKI